MHLSVILPAHDVAPFLPEALATLRAQTFADWECVAVDDGSGDASGRILDETARAEPRLRVVHQPNAGVGAARNRAIARATGTAVCFLDGDDTVAPDWLAMIASHIGDVDLLHFGGRAPERELRTREAIAAWGWATFVTDGYTCKNAVRASLAKRHPFPVGIPRKEDTLWALGLLPALGAVRAVTACPYVYRQREGSAVHSFYAAADALALIRAIGRLPGEDTRIRRARTAFVCYAICDWVARGDPRDPAAGGLLAAVRALREAGLIAPGSLAPQWRVAFRVWLRGGSVWGYRLCLFLIRMRARLLTRGG